jgi:tRNA threonylcarbamoyladenosine biosynthesis protein TsaB
MRILAIDASTEACSAALWRDGQVDCLFEVAPQQHTKIILPMIQELLQRNSLRVQDCSAIAFAQGPGSFTGLRIAAGVAQGLALAHNIPLISISTLASLALAGRSRYTQINYFVTALDARMDEVYFALYAFNDEEGMVAIIPDSLASPKEASRLLNQHLVGRQWIGVGSGLTLLQDQIEPPAINLLPDYYPSAQEIALLACASYTSGAFIPMDQAMPKYLRHHVVHTAKH